MNEIEKMLMDTYSLHAQLENAANNEKYNDNVKTKLDDLSYEVYKIRSDLNEIRFYLGA